MVKPDRCPTCKRLKRRSNESNRRYWLLLHLIADKLKPQDQSFSAESYHTYFKMRFLGSDEMKLPNGKVVQIPKSTADLDTQEFQEYVFRVEEWASNHEVFLDDIAAT